MPSLQTKPVSKTYKDLLNVYDGDLNEGLEAGLKTVQDGEGVASALQLSTERVKVTGFLQVGSDGCHFQGPILMEDDLEIEENGSINIDTGDINVGGNATVAGKIDTDSLDVGNIGGVSPGQIVCGTLKVDDHMDSSSIETGDLTVSGEATVTGKIDGLDGMDIDGAVDVSGSISSGAHLSGTTLESAGDLTVGGNISQTGGNFTTDGDINAESGDTTLNELIVVGDTNLQNDLDVSGSLGVDGIATLADGSKLNSNAAPTLDVQIANKKYVDDEVSGAGGATSLSTGTVDTTSYGITSDGGADDIVLAQASTTAAGVLSSAKWDEIVANTLKVTDADHNVDTDLSEGTSTETTVDVNSSDGNNATLVSASATRAGLLTKGKFDEIVVNTTHSGGDGSDHADVATNTTHSGGDGSDHADVATNTTHSGGSGSDHADVATNTTHSGGSGSDHADVATNTAKATCDTTNVLAALNADVGDIVLGTDINDTCTIGGDLNVDGDCTVSGEAGFESPVNFQGAVDIDGLVKMNDDLTFGGTAKMKYPPPTFDAFDFDSITETWREEPATCVDAYSTLSNKLNGGFMWNADGTSLWMFVWVFDDSKYGLFKWNLSTAYDLSTMTQSGLEAILDDGYGTNLPPKGMEWGTDGDVFYTWFESDNNDSKMSYYTAYAPYTLLNNGSIENYSYTGSVDLAEDNNGIGFSVHPNVSGQDGYIFYNHMNIGGSIGRITLTDDAIDSGTPDQTFSIPDLPSSMYPSANATVRMYDNGLKMVIACANGNVGSNVEDYYGFNRYSLSVAYDLTSTITLIEHFNAFDYNWKQDTSTFRWNPDGSKAYMTRGNRWTQHILGARENSLDLTTSVPTIGSGLDVNGQLSVTGAITSTGTISGDTFSGDGSALTNLTVPDGQGVNHQRYVHSFWSHNILDQISQSQITLPWSDTDEAASFTGRQGFLAPYDMNFVAWNLRQEDIQANHSITFKIWKIDQGTNNAIELGAYTFSVTDSEDFMTHQVTNANVQYVSVDAGDLVYLSIKASVAPYTASRDYYSTSHWTMDLDSTYTTGNV